MIVLIRGIQWHATANTDFFKIFSSKIVFSTWPSFSIVSGVVVRDDRQCGLLLASKEVTQLMCQFLPAATKLDQGNIFTGVCLSTGGEGCLPQCMLGYTLPPDQADTPQTRQTPPTPQTRQTPPTHPGSGRPPRIRQTPRTRQTPPRPGRHPPDQADTPTGKQTSAYGQRVAGTHPPGMHSCFGKRTSVADHSFFKLIS